MAVLVERHPTNRNIPLTPLSSSKQANKAEFSGPTITRSYAAILFDMDGTIIDSTNAIIKTWEKFAAKHISPAYSNR